MRKLDKSARVVNDCFRDRLQAEFKAEFGLELETNFSIIDMQLHSSRTDGRPLTKTQHRWVKVWEAGYLAALTVLREIGRRDRAGAPWDYEDVRGRANS